jgi:hypothetical protein
VDASRPHIRHPSSDDVEAGGDGDYVEFMECPVASEDSLRFELNDGRLVNVNNVNVRAVELLVEVLLETWSFDTGGVGRLKRSKKVTFPWIPNAIADISSPEVISASIGLGIKQNILVIPKPVSKPTMIPEFVVKGFLLFMIIFKYVLLVPAEKETTKAFLSKFVETGIMFLGVLLLLTSQWLFAHGNGEVRSTLEDLQGPNFWAPFLGDPPNE